MVEIKIHLKKNQIFHLSCCTNITESDKSQKTMSKNPKCQIFIRIASSLKKESHVHSWNTLEPAFFL